MSSKAVTDKKPEPQPPEGWKPARETAPSVVLPEEPRFARIIGTAALTALAMGVVTLILYMGYNRVGLIPPMFAMFMVAVGIVGLLFHAVSDRDQQIRRTYGMVGFLLLASALLVSALPLRNQPAGAHFLPWGFTGLALGLFFLLPFIRNEDDEQWRLNSIRILGAVGAALALTGFIGGSISGDFLARYGILLAALGIFYLWAFVAFTGIHNDHGYWAALGMGAVGLLAFLIALGRSVLPALFFKLGWIQPPAPAPYFIPSGLLLMLMGVIYTSFSLGLWTDNQFIVMTRRELMSFFYSPIAYIVLFGFTLIAFLRFVDFAGTMFPRGGSGLPEPLLEPIILPYFWSFLPVMALVMIVPALTMRLLSEEQRSGTLEVLLTAPVNGVTVVLSKYFAALIFFLLIWLPWGLFLIALRVEGGQPFDYRPLLSFLVALVCTGANFLAMGLFFSSLTRNQIIAAVLTFAGMLTQTFLIFVPRLAETLIGSSSSWGSISERLSYLALWQTTLSGKLPPLDLLIHVSVAVFALYLTVKVLEVRRWL